MGIAGSEPRAKNYDAGNAEPGLPDPPNYLEIVPHKNTSVEGKSGQNRGILYKNKGLRLLVAGQNLGKHEERRANLALQRGLLRHLIHELQAVA